MDEEYRGGRSVDRYDRDRYGFRYGLVSFWNKVLGFFGFVLLCLIGLGVWTERQYLWILGYLMLGAVVILTVLGVLAVCVAFMKWATAMRFFEVGQYGGYFQNWLGKLSPAAPLNPVAPKQGAASTQIDIAIPTLGELIRDGLLINEATEMLLGFRANGTPRYGSWPGVIAICGMQNVGKSVTMLMLILIALFQGAKVIVCDTHYHKPRSLWKKIRVLDGLVTFATTEQEVYRETLNFSGELVNRKQRGSSIYPYVIFYDEFCSLMRANLEELRKVLPTVMEEAGQEGDGFNMHFVAAIHDLSNAGIGDARLRGFFNWVYCHKMDAAQSKFIEAFKGRYGNKKTSMVIAGLKNGHVMARDESNEIEYLILPFGGEKDAALAAKELQRMKAGGSLLNAIPSFPALPQNAATKPTVRSVAAMPTMRDVPNTPTLRDIASVSTGHLPPMPDLPMKVNSQEEPGVYRNSHQTGPLDARVVNSLHTVNAPVDGGEAGETEEDIQDRSEEEEVVFTRDEELELLSAATQIFKEKGRVAYRTEIRDRLRLNNGKHWNNKQWSKIKAICVKYGL